VRPYLYLDLGYAEERVTAKWNSAGA
jgi:hypothetical protein